MNFQKYKRAIWDPPIREGSVQYFGAPGPPPNCIGKEHKCREEDPGQVSGHEVLIVKSLAASDVPNSYLSTHFYSFSL